MTYPCPACGFEVFDEPPGSYHICDVCGWEDDHVQLQYPAMRGGANRESLWEWQQRVLPTLSTKTDIESELRRCPDWRPLEKEDCRIAQDVPQTGMQYFEAACTDTSSYYWRKISSVKSDNRFDLWLEFEHLESKKGDDPEDDIFNMQIKLPSGKKYALNVWTFKLLDRIVQNCQNTGECLNGSYLLPPDLFVQRLDRKLIEQIVSELIANDELKAEWEVADNDNNE